MANAPIRATPIQPSQRRWLAAILAAARGPAVQSAPGRRRSRRPARFGDTGRHSLRTASA